MIHALSAQQQVRAVELLATMNERLELDHICYVIDYPRVVELEPGHEHTDACRCLESDQARADCSGCQLLDQVVAFRASVRP